MRSRRIRKGSNDDRVKIFLLRILILALIVYIAWASQNHIILDSIVYQNYDVKAEFTGYKIMHISDIGSASEKVVSIARKAKPDIIIVSGGYYNNNGSTRHASDILDKLSRVANTVYVYDFMDEADVQTNAEYIGDRCAELEFENGELIRICGIDSRNEEENLAGKIAEFVGFDDSDFNILVGCVQDIDAVSKSRKIDLMLCGGTLGTNRFSDKYNDGLYSINGMTVLITSGAGNEKGHVRIGKLPEVQLITLSDGTISDKNWLQKQLDKLIPSVETIFDKDGEIKSHTYSFKNEDNNEKEQKGNEEHWTGKDYTRIWNH